MKILLSPAKSLDYSRNIETPETTEAIFLDEADYLAKKLAKFSVKKIEKTMHISKDLATLNYDRYKEWERPVLKSEKVKAAVTVFTGEVYRGLDIESFSKEELSKAQEQLRILSGLYGFLKPLDLMYPYRLEMGTKWAVTPKKTNLYKFWDNKLTDALNAESKGEELIVNLASNEYFKVINTKELKGDLVTPVFKDLKGDSYKTIMMYAKNARGAMARELVKQNITNMEEIKSMNIDGYQFSEQLSSEKEMVFVR